MSYQLNIVENLKIKDIYFCNEETRKKELSETGLVEYIFPQDGIHHVKQYVLEIGCLFNSKVEEIIAGFNQVRDSQIFKEAMNILEKEFKYINL